MCKWLINYYTWNMFTNCNIVKVVQDFKNVYMQLILKIGLATQYSIHILTHSGWHFASITGNKTNKQKNPTPHWKQQHCWLAQNSCISEYRFTFSSFFFLPGQQWLWQEYVRGDRNPQTFKKFLLILERNRKGGREREGKGMGREGGRGRKRHLDL